MTANLVPQREKEQGAILAWDRRGVVIAWPDGQSRRFSWSMLRHVSECDDCHRQSATREAVPSHFAKVA